MFRIVTPAQVTVSHKLKVRYFIRAFVFKLDVRIGNIHFVTEMLFV